MSFKGDLQALRDELAKYPWDSEVEFVTLTPSGVVGMLQRFLAGTLTAADVEDWADSLWPRDDVGLDAGFEEVLKDVLFRLAVPEANGPITRALAMALIQELRPSEPR